MKNGGAVGANAQGRHHIAQLTDGGVSQHPLYVVRHQAHSSGKDGGEGPHNRQGAHSLVRGLENREEASHQKDTGRYHGSGVDEGAHRRGAFHSVGKPYVQRELGRFARGPRENTNRHPGQAKATQGGKSTGLNQWDGGVNVGYV